MVANRIAEKLGVGVSVQEDDGMIFTSFGRCGEIADRGSKDMILTPRERKMITGDLEIWILSGPVCGGVDMDKLSKLKLIF